ncbi:hypothetical protein BKK54_11260 [Rodentibacter genomosp. 1]|uniref:Uncharacterized protein n=1 Tax=Rodentibacter genomosp. 1 TaxID=1908264 RepID=A0A1V3J075_9PAST|nr:hypothetical protein [Rodentibacter genomosp. 1]OOF47999.1 hypothetical protein BKK54_11260 [Rodentibacter genomosp. 1]
MESRAEASKNHFKTQSLSYSDIENHSEVEVKSVSAGISTDMGQNAKNAMGAVASLLGNKQESEHSLTKSAISENIHIETETPENLTALLRDTANANQKVKAFDLEEIRERQEAAKVAGELFSKITGDVAKAFDFEDGSQEKILMHAVAGALAAKMGDGNVATGAVAGASSEWLNSYVTDYLKEQTKALNLEPQQKEKLREAAQQATALMIGAMAGAVTGGSSDAVKQGALASYNAESFNRQLHQNEKERIKILANGDEEKERRLEIAACALVHCPAQIPSDSPDYAEIYEKARALELLGNTAEYAQERALLKSQTETLFDPWGAGIKNKLFVYNESYKALDQATRIDSKYGVTTRAGGGVQAIGGVSAVAFGTGLCETGIGCAAGIPVVAYGADHAYTGAKAMVTGKPQYTMGGQLLSQMTGLTPELANLAYDLPNLYAGAKPLLGAMARVGNQVVAEGAKMASETGYVAREIGKDIVSGYSAIPKPYKVVFGIEATINTVAESIPYATGKKEINSNNLLQSGGKVLVDSTYSAATFKANDGVGFGLDVTKGLIEGKSVGDAVRDSGTSVWLSKNFGMFIKDERIKRLLSSSTNKVLENINNTSEELNKDKK